MERPIEPNERQSGADVLLWTFESTNAGFHLFPVRENLCPESNYSSLTAFSHKRNPASFGQQRKVNCQDNCHVPYFEHCVERRIVYRVHRLTNFLLYIDGCKGAENSPCMLCIRSVYMKYVWL
jgi:hypothetical protein